MKAIEQQILHETHDLPTSVLQEVLDFVGYLKQKYNVKSKLDSVLSDAEFLNRLPKHNVGKIHSSLRREDIYDDDGR